MLQTLSLFAPELWLAISASLLLGFGYWGGKDRSSFARYYAIVILIVFAVMSFVLGKPEGYAFKEALIIDSFARYAKLLIGFAAATALLFSKSYFEAEKLERYEYSVLVLYSVLGMSIMVSSNSLLSLYIGIEMQSLALYVMAAFNRDSLRASEAGLKYFVLGALSSGLLLYGASLIYGFTGSLEYPQIANSITEQGAQPGIVAGMVFLLCGLAFKISAAPFHMWTPDVYEGAPTPVTGFFSAAPKFAAMALIARVLIGPFEGITSSWQQVIVVISVLSMAVGALGALRQTNIKRLMAYSSIANMGYALVPLAAGTVAGIQGLLIFMSIYVISVIGIFALILQMRIRNGMVEKITDLSGLSKSNRGMAMLMTMFMFSLMGIPPLLGFFGKYFAFVPAAQAGLMPLVIIALIFSVIGAFYYLRVIKTMWFDEPKHDFVEASANLRYIALVAGLLILPIMIIPGISTSAQSLIATAAESLF